MRHDVQQLAERLDGFAFDEPQVKLSFAARLARENRWSRIYTDRVVCEYKRFALLAMVAGHSVTPSEQVDQAWHLHLTYTESYWHDFCGRVLGRPLHHSPTNGGEHERRKYRSDYERTRQTYRSIFGELPPEDIWPDARRRFGHDTQTIRINVGDWWLLAKPRWWHEPLRTHR
jgi:hypothetical protein